MTSINTLLRDGLTLIVDGTSIEVLRDMVAAQRRARDADEELPARVFEAAAGYAPTLGILGAVLGLIEVMHHLSEPARLGSGIAVAFVATVYGVGVRRTCCSCRWPGACASGRRWPAAAAIWLAKRCSRFTRARIRVSWRTS